MNQTTSIQNARSLGLRTGLEYGDPVDRDRIVAAKESGKLPADIRKRPLRRRAAVEMRFKDGSDRVGIAAKRGLEEAGLASEPAMRRFLRGRNSPGNVGHQVSRQPLSTRIATAASRITSQRCARLGSFMFKFRKITLYMTEPVGTVISIRTNELGG